MPLRELPRHAVHLWWATAAELDNPARRAQCIALMNDDERAQWTRFIPQHAREQHLLTRALCRAVLSQYMACPAHSWRFIRNAHGRPEIDPAMTPRLRFNLSHTRGISVCAVVWELDVGVDVEAWQRPTDVMSLADAVFANSERQTLAALPEVDRAAHFFRVWTVKEAYIKARGLGMAIPLREFAVRWRGTEVDRLDIPATWPDTSGDWQIALFQPMPAWQVAVAIHRPRQVDLAVTLIEGLPL